MTIDGVHIPFGSAFWADAKITDVWYVPACESVGLYEGTRLFILYTYQADEDYGFLLDLETRTGWPHYTFKLTNVRLIKNMELTLVEED